MVRFHCTISLVNIPAPSSFFATTTQKLSREGERETEEPAESGDIFLWHLLTFLFYQIKSTFFLHTMRDGMSNNFDGSYL